MPRRKVLARPRPLQVSSGPVICGLLVHLPADLCDLQLLSLHILTLLDAGGVAMILVSRGGVIEEGPPSPS